MDLHRIASPERGADEESSNSIVHSEQAITPVVPIDFSVSANPTTFDIDRELLPEGIVGYTIITDPRTSQPTRIWIRDALSEFLTVKQIVRQESSSWFTRAHGIDPDQKEAERKAQNKLTRELGKFQDFDLLVDLEEGPVLGSVQSVRHDFRNGVRDGYSVWYPGAEEGTTFDAEGDAFYGDPDERKGNFQPRTVIRLLPNRFDYDHGCSVDSWPSIEVLGRLLQIAIAANFKAGLNGFIEAEIITENGSKEILESCGFLPSNKQMGYNCMHLDRAGAAQWEALLTADKSFTMF